MPVPDLGWNGDDRAGLQADGGFPFLLVPALAGCADEDLSAAFSCVVDVPVASAARFKGYVGQK